MRSEELNLVQENYALRIRNYAFAAMNSSLSDRRERSLLTLIVFVVRWAQVGVSSGDPFADAV